MSTLFRITREGLAQQRNDSDDGYDNGQGGFDFDFFPNLPMPGANQSRVDLFEHRMYSPSLVLRACIRK